MPYDMGSRGIRRGFWDFYDPLSREDWDQSFCTNRGCPDASSGVPSVRWVHNPARIEFSTHRHGISPGDSIPSHLCDECYRSCGGGTGDRRYPGCTDNDDTLRYMQERGGIKVKIKSKPKQRRLPA